MHDPKLAHETEVNAQVKLNFKSVTGATLYASRSLKVVQKRNKLEMKTMDASLQVVDEETGERVRDSSRLLAQF